MILHILIVFYCCFQKGSFKLRFCLVFFVEKDLTIILEKMYNFLHDIFKIAKTSSLSSYTPWRKIDRIFGSKMARITFYGLLKILKKDVFFSYNFLIISKVLIFWSKYFWSHSDPILTQIAKFPGLAFDLSLDLYSRCCCFSASVRPLPWSNSASVSYNAL